MGGGKVNAKITALDELIKAVEAGDKWISVKAAAAFDDKGNAVMACRAYGAEWNHERPGSLDAAKALHDALLPGWGYRVSPGYAIVMHPRLSGPAVEKDATAQENPARAWLLAILRAYRAQIGGVE